jgi:hypothetical protein
VCHRLALLEGQKENKDWKNARQNKMDKNIKLLSIIFLTLFSATLMLPSAQGFYGHYTISNTYLPGFVTASRCDHLVDILPPNSPSTEDAWTAIGIKAHISGDPDYYDWAEFTYERGYGAYYQQYHRYTTSGPLNLGYTRPPYAAYDYSDYGTAIWKTPPSVGWPAYYHMATRNTEVTVETFGSYANSWFLNIYELTQVYIYSNIYSNHMFASDPYLGDHYP